MQLTDALQIGCGCYLIRAADPRPENIACLYLEPGLAFGSGSHPTTRMCLSYLAESVRPGQRILDFGCGSGILAIAAALLGATAVGVDHDDQAVLATTENARFNAVDGDQLQVFNLQDWQRLTESDLALRCGRGKYLGWTVAATGRALLCDCSLAVRSCCRAFCRNR